MSISELLWTRIKEHSQAGRKAVRGVLAHYKGQLLQFMRATYPKSPRFIRDARLRTAEQLPTLTHLGRVYALAILWVLMLFFIAMPTEVILAAKNSYLDRHLDLSSLSSKFYLEVLYLAALIAVLVDLLIDFAIGVPFGRKPVAYLLVTITVVIIMSFVAVRPDNAQVFKPESMIQAFYCAFVLMKATGLFLHYRPHVTEV